MAFQTQKEHITKFYDQLNEVVHNHHKSFDKLVNKLNQKSGLTQVLTRNLDDFMTQSFPDLNQYQEDVNENNLNDDIIDYVYDINKKDYIPDFNLPDKKIIIKQNFKLVLIDETDGITNANGTPHQYGGNGVIKTKKKFKKRNYMSKSGSCFEGLSSIKKECNCNNTCNHGLIINDNVANNYNLHTWKITGGVTGYKKQEEQTLEIWIDNYFNIYIPNLKTYLVYNYSIFPLYAFYANRDKLNLYHNQIEDGSRIIMFNNDNASDKAEYNLIKSFLQPMKDYLTSKDRRDEYKELFPKLLEFYQYNNKHTFFSQYQDLSEIFDKISPSDIKSKLETSEDTMVDEKHIFAQSQRIRELEIINHSQLEELVYLRNMRKENIEKESEMNNKLNDYQKLLEELNGQLHNEIDNFSFQKKEIIKYKQNMLECNEMKTKYRKLMDIKNEIVNQNEELKSKMMKLNTVNNSLIDKQTESLQKLIKIRKLTKYEKNTNKELKLDIVNYNKQIRQYEINIEIEKQLHRNSKNKIDELIKNMNDNKSDEDNDEYQEILLNQIKDKNDDIKKLNIKINRINLDKDKVTKQFQQLKNKLAGLI